MTENKKENYHILSLIGQGAYGYVYKARKKFTGQFVAVKTIKKKGKEEKDIKTMRQQIQILKKLKHQNIVLLLDSFQTPSEFILVTQLGQGVLFDVVEDERCLEQPQIRKVAQQLVRALHYIHTNRIMHRDMKPQNILMTSDGVVKLCDFGFARHMSFKTEVLTSIKGTPLYMAPQVVNEKPYSISADLWSLGIILFELATGDTPFTGKHLIDLVEHINKDPIIYPQSINGDFKNFLKGLLQKQPTKRLGWPDLLNHPFIRQTEQQKIDRKRKVEQFSNWIQENHCIGEEEVGSSLNHNENGRSISQTGFDQRSRDISPKKQNMSCNDASWNKFVAIVSEEKGPSQLRSDASFLDSLLKVLETNVNDIIRTKQKRSLLVIALKVLTQVLMKSKSPQNRKIDISKNLNIPNLLLGILRGLLKVDGGKQFVQIISDITKLIGLLAKVTFNKSFGIQMVYIRSFLPQLNKLVKCAVGGIDNTYQTFTINLLRTIGIFANNASANHIRSFSFYKDVIEMRFVQQAMAIIKHYHDHLSVLKLFVQVLSAFMHPIYGDIECFPWRRASSSGILQFKECEKMLECVKQSIVNSLLENNCADLFEQILSLEDEASMLPRISIERIILQAMRQSKQFTEFILFQQRSIVKHIFATLTNQDQIVFGTTCEIVGQMLKYTRDRKKEKSLEPYLAQYLPVVLERIKEIQKNNSNLISIFGALFLLQEAVAVDNNSYLLKIVQHIQTQKNFCKIISDYLSNPQTNKLQEMRKLEGSNYGLHLIGLYDPAFLFLHRLIVKLQKQSPPKYQQIMRILRESKLQLKISQIITTFSSKTDLSPRGLISLLMLTYDLISVSICDEFAQESFFQGLIQLLKEQQIDTILEWPVNFGGGEVCLTTMFGNLMKIFLIYLQQAQKEPQIVRIIYNQKLLQLLVGFSKFLSQQTINSVITFILHLIAFDKNQGKAQIKDSRPFIRQFIQANGMSLFVRFNLLKGQMYSSTNIIQSCNLLSQIARHSKDFYEFIQSIDPYDDIRKLISHSDPQIRSRVLNLIGNMCRHSGFFYKKLQTHQILKECISMCQDDDKTIKKFACVAIGNASFHDSTLYQSLKPAIPILVSLLKDSEEKTRSNAAAALGNLARNSQILDKDFINTGANYQLANMLNVDKSSAAKKVSIMAIINLLQLPQSKKVLLSLNIGSLLQKMLAPPFNSDPGLVKTAQKALQKLK